MTIGNSIMNMFRNQPDPQQQQQLQQGQQQQQQAQAQQTTNGEPVKPADPLAKQEEVSGLDRFNDLWQTPVKKEGEAEEAKFDPSNLFDLSPQTLGKNLEGFSVANSVSKDDLAAITAGGEEAASALLRILDSSTRATLQTAVMASGRMTESAFGRALPTLDGKINSQVRSNQIGTQLNAQSPLMKSDAAKPMLTALATQFSSKHPNASPDEVVAMVNDYMVTFGESMGLQKPDASNKRSQSQGKESIDWNTYWNN